MLFEEAMMAIHYGFSRDMAFTTVPADAAEERRCSDYQVGWGVRGRIAEEQVISRARAGDRGGNARAGLRSGTGRAASSRRHGYAQGLV